MAPGTCGGGGMHLGVALHAHASEAASLAQALALARQGGPRRDAGGMGGTGGHGVDVTDVQTMADSWLRLLEVQMRPAHPCCCFVPFLVLVLGSLLLRLRCCWGSILEAAPR